MAAQVPSPASSGPQLVKLPADLPSVTQYDPAQECPPDEVGLTPGGVARIWVAVQDLYRTGLHPGITLTLRRQGRVVLNRAIGHARGRGPGDPADEPAVPMQPDTPVCLFSASKAITAMLVHKLSEERRLRLRDRVADYVPEYGVRGKSQTTLRHLLSHRAGIPSIPMKNPDPALLYDWDQAVSLLCAAKPLHMIGWIQAYHAITAGFILGEVIRRVSGMDLREYMTRTVRQPLGMRYFNYGVEPHQLGEVARNYFTGTRPLFPVSYVAKRALGIEFDKVPAISNDPRYLSAVIPAGNIYATADEACRFFEMMLNGGQLDGRRIFETATIEKALRPAGIIQFDRSLMLPLRFSSGMMLGEWPAGLYGRNCASAFGHLGFINIVCWADPARDISAALLNTGKSMTVEGIAAFVKLLLTISEHCPPLPPAERRALAQPAAR